MVSTVTIAARPGVVAEPSLSSLTVRQTSQPQNAKIEPTTPAMKAESSRPVNGLNHVQEKGRASGSSPPRERVIATTTNSSRMSIWNDTSTTCTRSDVVIPR